MTHKKPLKMRLVTKTSIIVTKNEIGNKNKEKKMSIKNNCRDCRYLYTGATWYTFACKKRKYIEGKVNRYKTFPFRYTSCRFFKKKTLLFKILEYLRSK